MTWETVIGLEVHVQLKTQSKMFCACSTRFGDPPNTNVCPVCLGLPGSLPVPNGSAVRLAVRAALALGCTVHERSVFARKSYFYPDLPKGYQISQFRHPLATRGRVEIGEPGHAVSVRIARLHLEEDAGKSFHDRVPGLTAVDFNRCGIPLIEIVSEPDLRVPADARRYLTFVKQLLEYLDVSDCNMEEGSLRVDANLSVRRGGEALGTKQEIKNLNSFAAAEGALEQLRDAQIAARTRGDPIALTTFTAATGELRAMRVKEESHDYRYFSDPDLPPLVLHAAGIDSAVEAHTLPELPPARAARFMDAYALSEYDARVLTASRSLADYFETAVTHGAEPKPAANWVMGPVLAEAKTASGSYRVSPARLARLLALIGDGTLSTQAAKRVFAALAERDDDPRDVAARLGLVQVADADRLAAWVDEVLARYPAEVERYAGGEARLEGFFMGEVMKASGGTADPKAVHALLRARVGR